MAGNNVFLSLGSNIGNRADYLKSAIRLITSNSEINVVNYSSIYETDPVGYEDQDRFLNMVMQIETGMPALELLRFCLKVEKELGRKREIVWGPRTIDIDILLYNQENIETEELKVPHPRMHLRAFVMIPLIEISNNINVPKIEKPLELLVEDLPDKKGVAGMETEKWGRRIRAFRKLKGFTQENFARRLGVSVSILGEIERGNRMATYDFLQQVATILNIEIEELAPPDELE